MTEALDRTRLPPRVAEIAEVIGEAGALAVVQGWGGLRLYVPEPEHLHAEHALVRALGTDGAGRLCARYAREKIDVPRCAAAVRAARDERIRREHREGASARQLALRHRLTERQVWKILGRDAAPDPTGDLFDAL